MIDLPHATTRGGERWSVSVKFDMEDMDEDEDEDGLEIERDILYDTLVKATIPESEVRIFTLTFTLS